MSPEAEEIFKTVQLSVEDPARAAKLRAEIQDWMGRWDLKDLTLAMDDLGVLISLRLPPLRFVPAYMRELKTSTAQHLKDMNFPYSEDLQQGASVFMLATAFAMVFEEAMRRNSE